jgi:hypothetical protein
MTRGCYPKCPIIPRSSSDCNGVQPQVRICCARVEFDYSCLDDDAVEAVHYQELAACALTMGDVCEWGITFFNPGECDDPDAPLSDEIIDRIRMAGQIDMGGGGVVPGTKPLAKNWTNLYGQIGSDGYGNTDGTTDTENIACVLGGGSLVLGIGYYGLSRLTWKFNCYTGLVDFELTGRQGFDYPYGVIAVGSFPTDWYLAPITLTALDPRASNVVVSISCADTLPCEPIDCFPSCISGTEDCDGVTPTHPFLFVNVAFNGVMGKHNMGYNEGAGYFEAGPILTADETAGSYFESVSFRLRCIDGAPDLRVLRRVWHSYDSYDETFTEYDGPITIECEGGEVTITEGGYLIFSNNNGFL